MPNMIDWSRVRQLQQEVGAGDIEEVVTLFFEEVSEAITRLETLADRSALSEDLHFLKGSALSLGFEEMSLLCKSGEKAAEAGAADSVDLAAIISCYAVSKQVFLSDYQQKLAA